MPVLEKRSSEQVLTWLSGDNLEKLSRGVALVVCAPGFLKAEDCQILAAAIRGSPHFRFGGNDCQQLGPGCMSLLRNPADYLGTKSAIEEVLSLPLRALHSLLSLRVPSLKGSQLRAMTARSLDQRYHEPPQQDSPTELFQWSLKGRIRMLLPLTDAGGRVRL